MRLFVVIFLVLCLTSCFEKKKEEADSSENPSQPSTPTTPTTPSTPSIDAASLHFSDGLGEIAITKSAMMTWDVPTSTNPIDHYEIKIGTSLGGGDVIDWTNIGSVTSYQATNQNFLRGRTYYATLRAVDQNGLTSEVQGDGWNVINEFWKVAPGSVVTSMASTSSTTYWGGNFSQVAEDIPGVSFWSLSTGQISSFKPRVQGGSVSSVLPDGQGGYYIGGNFTSVNNVARKGLAHVYADGTLDSWSPQVTGSVLKMATYGNDLYVAGNLTAIDGISRTYIASFSKITGLLNAWSPSVSASITAMVISGSTLYLGGNFTSINSTTRNRIASIDLATGNLTTWDPNLDGNVTSFYLTNSTLYAVGAFTTIGGVAHKYVGAFDLSTGSVSSWAPNLNGPPNAVTISSNKFYVAGGFITAEGQSRQYIAGYNLSDNSLTSFNPTMTAIPTNMAASGTTLYITGSFVTVAGQSRYGVASFDTTTDTLTSWSAGITTRSSLSMTGVSINGDTVAVMGNYYMVRATPIKNLAAFDNATGALVNTWVPNPNNTVKQMILDGTDLYVMGDFDTIAATSRTALARFNSNTKILDSTFNPVIGLNPGSQAGNISLINIGVTSSTIFVAGGFELVNGQSRANLAGIDKSSSNVTSWNPQLNDSITAMIVAGNQLYVGVNYSGNTASACFSFCSYDLNSMNLTNFAPSPNGIPAGFAKSKTALYVYGSFDGFAGLAANRKLAGSFNLNDNSLTSWDSNTNATGDLNDILVMQGNIYIAGPFTTVNGGAAARTAVASYSEATGNLNPGVFGVANVSKLNAANDNMAISYSAGSGQSGLKFFDPITDQLIY